MYSLGGASEQKVVTEPIVPWTFSHPMRGVSGCTDDPTGQEEERQLTLRFEVENLENQIGSYSLTRTPIILQFQPVIVRRILYRKRPWSIPSDRSPVRTELLKLDFRQLQKIVFGILMKNGTRDFSAIG